MTAKNNKSGNTTGQIQAIGDGQFQVTGDLDFNTVPQVWKSSVVLFNGQKSLTVDLSGVNRSNSAGLGLLIEWMRYADSRGCSIKFLNLPEQMHQVAQLCGVEEKLPV